MEKVEVKIECSHTFVFSTKLLNFYSFKSISSLYMSFLDFIFFQFKTSPSSASNDDQQQQQTTLKRGCGKGKQRQSAATPTNLQEAADEDEDAIRLFMKLMAYLFLFFSIIIPLVLLPINSRGAKQLGGLATLTITNIDPASSASTTNDFYVTGNPVLWAHVTMSYLLVLPTRK